MHFLVSGEGLSDIGYCDMGEDSCSGSVFKHGPMSIIIDQLVEGFQGFDMSHIYWEQFHYVSEGFLAKNKVASSKKSMSLRGKKREVETKYFYENARALAALAKQKSEEVKDTVIAVLFRDGDGTASAGRGEWRDKRNSMRAGFRQESFETGVAMMPKPKSEAWLLCALKENPYQHCATLENESGNDKSTNPLKQQLDEAMDGNSGTSQLNALLRDQAIDISLIDMPSFNIFKEDLKQAVRTARAP